MSVHSDAYQTCQLACIASHTLVQMSKISKNMLLQHLSQYHHMAGSENGYGFLGPGLKTGVKDDIFLV